VFGVAWAFVAHTDSRFHPEALRRFVAAYQRVQPLTMVIGSELLKSRQNKSSRSLPPRLTHHI